MAKNGSLGLPRYSNNKDQQRWVKRKIQTSEFIQVFWRAANRTQRADPPFLRLMIQFGWTNQSKKRPDPEPTRRWRNHLIAVYLKVPGATDEQLEIAISRAFPQISRKKASALLSSKTGVTHYYTPLRTAILNLVSKNPSIIRRALEVVSSKRKDQRAKVQGGAELIEKLGFFKVGRRRRVSPFNGISPTMACLDPNRAFPIMNDQTRTLLRLIQQRHDAAGLLALHDLIGQYGIRDSFELDAYVYRGMFPKAKKYQTRRVLKTFGKELGFKSEMESVALLQKRRVLITKKHNALTNRLRRYIRWRHKIVREDRFDALLESWKPGRNLLIEVKTAWSGRGGRAQVRMAIGQLFDYRLLFQSPHKLEVAILLPTQPNPQIKALLQSAGIEALWFSGSKVAGTIAI